MNNRTNPAKRLRQEAGSVSSWLILGAGLAAAAFAASLVMQQTIGQLAENVGARTAAIAPVSPASPPDTGGTTSAGSTGTGDNTSDTPDARNGVEPGDAAADSGRDDTDDGERGGPDPTQIGSGADVAANGVDFTIGEYQEPQIQHDNGHLQDQSDLSNPVPEPTRAPTQEEIDYYNEQLDDVVLGDRVSWLPLDQDWIPFRDPDERFAWDNAIPAYRHFLEGNGADRTFDMDDYLTSDPAGQVVEQSLLEDASTATDFALNDLATSGDLPVGEPVAFTITSDTVTTSETSIFYPYPSTTDWQRTVGGMQVWTTTDVVATRQPDGTVDVSTSTTIHGEDRYNFNWNQQAIDNGEPDWLRGRLELGDLAHQYTQTGSTDRTDDRTIDLP